MTDIEIMRADLSDAVHQDAVLAMLDAYSADPMGDAQPLSDYARTRLVQGLREHPTTLVYLAFCNNQPSGIVTCFRGFSTFAARPLVNIHDVYVVPSLRGRGVGCMLLKAAEDEARATGCCKLTLEVQQNNARARSVYEQFGFAQAVYAADAEGGGSLFMTKMIS